MNILIVEDDYIQAEWILTKLSEAFPGAKIGRISTEFAFRSRLDEIAKNPPDVIVMDIMLRWADPSPDMPPPPDEVKKGNYYRAGLRCQKLLEEGVRTGGIPVILYTVLEPKDLHKELSDLRPNVLYLRKEPSLAPLVSRIRSLTKR